MTQLSLQSASPACLIQSQQQNCGKGGTADSMAEWKESQRRDNTHLAFNAGFSTQFYDFQNEIYNNNNPQ